jgi:hypothetical protein
MLLLARIDGKSPAEYLTDETKRDFARRFVYRHLPERDFSLSQWTQQWFAELRQRFGGPEGQEQRQG